MFSGGTEPVHGTLPSLVPSPFSLLSGSGAHHPVQLSIYTICVLPHLARLAGRTCLLPRL